MLLLSAKVSNRAASAITSAAETASSFLRPARLPGSSCVLVEACILGHLQDLPLPTQRLHHTPAEARVHTANERFLLHAIVTREALVTLSAYSPKCVEGEFCEVQLRDAERRRVRRVMSSSCSQPSPTKE